MRNAPKVATPRALITPLIDIQENGEWMMMIVGEVIVPSALKSETHSTGNEPRVSPLREISNEREWLNFVTSQYLLTENRGASQSGSFQYRHPHFHSKREFRITLAFVGVDVRRTASGLPLFPWVHSSFVRLRHAVHTSTSSCLGQPRQIWRPPARVM